MPALLPVLQEALQAGSWRPMEAGILALGAVAAGCFDQVVPHLPELFPFLERCLAHDEFVVRSVACWTISRFSEWICDKADAAFLARALSALSVCVRDPAVKVQEAACSALALLEEEAGELLVPFVAPLVDALTSSFAHFPIRNYRFLYDCIGNLAQSVRDAMSHPDVVERIMQTLQLRWEALADDNECVCVRARGDAEVPGACA